MNYLKRALSTRILNKDGQEKLIYIQPNPDDALVFKFFNRVPGMYYITPENRPPGYIDPDELPDPENPAYQGRILFDAEGHWIYDGAQLNPNEQEQLVAFISKGDEQP